jgi:hypothetical protein
MIIPVDEIVMKSRDVNEYCNERNKKGYNE